MVASVEKPALERLEDWRCCKLLLRQLVVLASEEKPLDDGDDDESMVVVVTLERCKLSAWASQRPLDA